MNTDRPIGIIHAEGVGPEIMRETLRCLDAVQQKLGITLQFVEYKGEAPARSFNQTLYENLKSFYQEIKNQNGCILRSAIYAKTVYQLRRDFELIIKPIHFVPFPELRDSGFLPGIPSEKIDFLIVRENSGDFMPFEELIAGHEVGKREYQSRFIINEALMTAFVRYAFGAAEKRKKKSLFFLIKKDIESVLVKLWLEIFQRVSREYPEVMWLGAGHPDTVFLNISAAAEKFDVIATLNREGDLITDPLALLLYGSHAIVPSVNISPDGFMVFQTVHGTGSGIAKQGKANPIGLIRSAALMLKTFFKRDDAAEAIEYAVHTVLRHGFRTIDVYREHSGHTLVGTQEMGERIASAINKWIETLWIGNRRIVARCINGKDEHRIL